MKKLSVAIPTSTMIDGDYLFRRCLDSLWIQSFQDFEIVVTDNSDDDVIEKICSEYKTGIKYVRNPVKGMAQNTNEAIRQSKGEIIKILYMDDFLAHEGVLERIQKIFKKQWLVTGCIHTITGDERFNAHHPDYMHDIHTGRNSIGSPSVLTIRNKNPMMFDENMTWLLDCDYYKRMYEKYGPPQVLYEIMTVIGVHEGQATNTMGDERKLQEHKYMEQKYA